MKTFDKLIAFGLIGTLVISSILLQEKVAKLETQLELVEKNLQGVVESIHIQRAQLSLIVPKLGKVERCLDKMLGESK